MNGAPIEAFQAEPHVQWSHIDGPLLSWCGHLHWLTWRERFAIWIGRETPETIAQKHWPQRKEFALKTGGFCNAIIVKLEAENADLKADYLRVHKDSVDRYERIAALEARHQSDLNVVRDYAALCEAQKKRIANLKAELQSRDG